MRLDLLLTAPIVLDDRYITTRPRPARAASAAASGLYSVADSA